MKNLIFFLFIALHITACKEYQQPIPVLPDPADGDPDIPYFDFHLYQPGAQSRGSAQASVFDKSWSASAFVWKTAPDTAGYFAIYFETVSDDMFLREQIGFGVFKGLPGTYHVHDNPYDNQWDDDTLDCIYTLFVSDGDVIYGDYRIDSTYNNQIIIDKNDGVALEGRFNLLFKLRNGDAYTDIPRQVFFKNGTFRVNL